MQISKRKTSIYFWVRLINGAHILLATQEGPAHCLGSKPSRLSGGGTHS